MLPYNQFYVKPICFGISYVILGLLLIVIGSVFTSDATAAAYNTEPIMYTSKQCSVEESGQTCVHKINFAWNCEHCEGKDVFVYYHLRNFYQSHRAFVTNGLIDGLTYTQTNNSYNTQFNDVYFSVQAANDASTEYKVETTGISYPAEADYMINPKYPDDKEYPSQPGGGKYNHIYNPSQRFCRVEGRCECRNESCTVWRKPAPAPNFYKLYGIIKKGFPKKQNYTMRIVNRYDVSPWDGEKGVRFSVMGSYGGVEGSKWLGQFSSGLGCVVICMAIFLIVLEVLSKMRLLPFRDVDEYLHRLTDSGSVDSKQLLALIKKYHT